MGGRIGIYASADVAYGNDGIRSLVAVSRLQRQTHKYLTYGEMVRPPRWVGPEPRRLLTPGSESRPAVTIEAVERAAWQAPDGSVGLCLVNYSTEPLEVEFDLSSVANLNPTKNPRVISGATDSSRGHMR